MVLRDLIGVPYKEHGRDLSGLDCYGLVILAMKILTDIDLPDVLYQKTDVRSNKETFNSLISKVKYIKLEKALKYCIIVFDRGTHCGVYLGHGEFIHCNKNGVNIAQLNSWQCRVSGYYKVCNN